MTTPPDDLKVSFSHIQIYVDQIDCLDSYKELEKSLTKFSKQVDKEFDNFSDHDIVRLAKLWHESYDETPGSRICDASFTSQNRDVIKQLIVGFGFRITGYRFPSSTTRTSTKTVLVTSKDESGVQIVVSAAIDNAGHTSPDEYDHLDARNLNRFFQGHSERQGISVLGFYVSDVELVYKRYQQKHPKLISTFHDYKTDGTKVLEVFAYYEAQCTGSSEEEKSADIGTVLRFVETDNSSGLCPLPGLTHIDAVFDSNSQPAYCDHWVSNVFSRTEFLSTLNDTLGFTPKVSSTK